MIRARHWSPPVLFGLAAAAVLEVVVRSGSFPDLVLPRPSAVVAAFWGDRVFLRSGFCTTAIEALAGFLASALIGIIAAVALAGSVWARRAIYPYTVLLQTVPIIAIAPMLVLWIGPGFAGVAVSSFLVSVFPVMANTLTGLTGTDPGLVDLFRLYRAGPLSTMFKLRLRFATPEIIAGVRIAGGLSVVGAVVAEGLVGVLGENEGLGSQIVNAATNGRADRVFAGVLAASGLGIGLFAVVNAVGYFLFRRWHSSFTVQEGSS